MATRAHAGLNHLRPEENHLANPERCGFWLHHALVGLRCKQFVDLVESVQEDEDGAASVLVHAIYAFGYTLVGVMNTGPPSMCPSQTIQACNSSTHIRVR